MGKAAVEERVRVQVRVRVKGQVHSRPEVTVYLNKHVPSLEEVDEFLNTAGAAGEGITQRRLDCRDVGAHWEDEHGGELGWVTGHALQPVRVGQLVKLKHASECEHKPGKTSQAFMRQFSGTKNKPIHSLEQIVGNLKRKKNSQFAYMASISS